jgi:uncharacterized protein YjbI with pentapeptide repeats
MMKMSERDTHSEEQETVVPKQRAWWKPLWDWVGFGDKTLWNWLQLLSALAIPIAVALATGWFAAQQSATQIEIEEQRAQDDALQAYLDQMNNLLLAHHLRSSTENSEVRTLARARTLTVLGRLDSKRQRQVMQFLIEAHLVGSTKEGKLPVIKLSGADLSGADLSPRELSLGALLDGAILGDANLSRANLTGAHLDSAWLADANLSHANLSHANLSQASLIQAALNGAWVADANLSGPDFQGANLEGANLHNALLEGAILLGVRLKGANLSGANLTGANLSISNEELEQQAYSLEGATMPNGQKYKEWLKSKGSGADGENTGPG